MSLASSDGLETAWESVWRVRGGVGGRGKGKKRDLEDPGIDLEFRVSFVLVLFIREKRTPVPPAFTQVRVHMCRCEAGAVCLVSPRLPSAAGAHVLTSTN